MPLAKPSRIGVAATTVDIIRGGGGRGVRERAGSLIKIYDRGLQISYASIAERDGTRGYSKNFK